MRSYLVPSGLLLFVLGCTGEPVAGPHAAPDALAAARPVVYSITDISSGPTDDSYTESINDANEVAGWSNTPTGAHGWVWVGGRVT